MVKLFFSTNAKKFEQTKGGLILHLEGEHAKTYGSTMITTLPYVILCGQVCRFTWLNKQTNLLVRSRPVPA